MQSDSTDTPLQCDKLPVCNRDFLLQTCSLNLINPWWHPQGYGAKDNRSSRISYHEDFQNEKLVLTCLSARHVYTISIVKYQLQRVPYSIQTYRKNIMAPWNVHTIHVYHESQKSKMAKMTNKIRPTRRKKIVTGIKLGVVSLHLMTQANIHLSAPNHHKHSHCSITSQRSQ